MAMEPLIFVINPGSTSKKYALYRGNDLEVEVKIESVGGGYQASVSRQGQTQNHRLDSTTFEQPTQWTLEQCFTGEVKFEDLAAFAIRVVGPGELFSRHQLVNPEYIRKLEAVVHQAPLHINPVLKEIYQLTQHGQAKPIFAISDSAFHQPLPDKAKYYGINLDDAHKYDIVRYGYHGISLSGVVSSLTQMCGSFPSRVIACHLGGGASVTAIKDQKSIDTSMGLTPLEGLMMNTRGGDVDDGALIRLAQQSGKNLLALEEYLYKQCGLYGISGQTGDIRELLELEKTGHQRAKLALDMFVYRIKKYIGSYFAILGGLDVLVFTGTIGERSSILRERIVAELDCLGLVLDKEKNQTLYESSGWINPQGSPAGIAVIATNEMKQIASETVLLLK